MNMQKLTREDLYTLEHYATVRAEFREKVLAHKRNRRLELGTNAALYFEDRMTMQYQIQEMLRIERIFEAEGINDELEAYNPLIPDGSNWKATFMVEFPRVEERKAMLSQLIGIENRVYVQVADFDRVHPIANEDLARETEEKTSAVHFLRFELPPEQVAALHGDIDGAPVLDYHLALRSQSCVLGATNDPNTVFRYTCVLSEFEATFAARWRLLSRLVVLFLRPIESTPILTFHVFGQRFWSAAAHLPR